MATERTSQHCTMEQESLMTYLKEWWTTLKAILLTPDKHLEVRTVKPSIQTLCWECI